MKKVRSADEKKVIEKLLRLARRFYAAGVAEDFEQRVEFVCSMLSIMANRLSHEPSVGRLTPTNFEIAVWLRPREM